MSAGLWFAVYCHGAVAGWIAAGLWRAPPLVLWRARRAALREVRRIAADRARLARRVAPR